MVKEKWKNTQATFIKKLGLEKPAKPKNMKTPNQLLNMLLKHSTEKPYWM